ncbi:RNA-binding protein nob1 [Plakobranchus ocellatus]|uniref:RNA-binding protein NOB1 n=1 Tax=Plakobranchus ocellatus TaxID=259542 RepID=A0AAV3XYH3_9GAST|nr:RNA-binding protein nob1 [Plakobranchus ocellatus]
MASKIQHVVADAGAFIRNAPLRDIAENIYTVPEVIAESCDRATRRRLKTLPLDIKFKEPSGDAVLIITAFAKKTGDYRNLSAVDLKVLALTYDLEKQSKGVAHLRREPEKNPQWAGAAHTASQLQAATSNRQYTEGEALPSNLIGEQPLDDDSDEEDFFDAEELTDENEEDVEGANIEEHCKIQSQNGDAQILEETDKSINEDDEDEEEEDDDDDDGWITPANISDVKRSMGLDTVSSDQVCVGCLTTDFAMQNVLIQMGLNVLSVDGMLIKRAKSYVLRCFGCMRITKDTSKIFCPHCGNKTLKRLSTTIDEDGTVRYWLAKNYTIRTRGTKQRQTKKAKQRLDILSDDIVSGSSPFRMNDVTSRAAQLGINNKHPPQWAKRNPNEGRRKVNKRKGK